MTNNVPQKHRALAHAWVDGADIQYFNTFKKEWSDTRNPDWVDKIMYRIKKIKVKKWRIIETDITTKAMYISNEHYSDKEISDFSARYKNHIHEKILSTEIEVEE